MADITMCYGENCEQKERCYRYTAPINCYGQSVFANTPKEKPCPHFLDNTGRRDGRKIGVWWGDFRKIRKHQDENLLKSNALITALLTAIAASAGFGIGFAISQECMRIRGLN